VLTAAPDAIVLGGPEVPMLDCAAEFVAQVSVEAQHVGMIFFRQYLLSLTRKDDACGRGPMGVVKGPALDSRPIYNHPAGVAGSTGTMPVLGGRKGQLTMTDMDAPSQVVDPPVCTFKDKDQVALFASDLFRLVVIWAPANGPPVALGHRDWVWHVRGGFSKLGSSWIHGPSSGSTGPSPSVVVRPGVEPSTSAVILGPTIMVGKAAVSPF
jgi:hypothetical protein